MWLETNLSQYGGAHEHKGPADFNGRGNMEDDDDDDMGTPPLEDQLPQEHGLPEHALPPHLQEQQQHNFGHIRQAPSASPPLSNGVPFHHRQHTPQPQMGSRPASRNAVRRPSSNLGPSHLQQGSQAPQGPNGYAYMPNPPIYNPHAAHGMPVAPHHGQQPGPQPQYYPQSQPHQQQPPPPPPQHPQVQQAFMQEQRRQSMPPAFPPQERPQPQQPTASPPQPEREQRPEENQPNRIPKPAPAKSRSIFTPIDDSRSLLAQHWGIGTTKNEIGSDIKSEKDKDHRSQSVDVGTIERKQASAPTPPPPRPQRVPSISQRNQPSAMPGEFPPPSRTNSAQVGAKRPRLKVQIPSEQSDGGSATAESSPRESGGTAGDTPAKASTEASHSSGVVLPPPSPSASAILSAGAQGPPNPFARPHPPMNNGNPNSQVYGNNNIETPISALPSRFVADGLLPSPSSFYPEWGFGRQGGESNLLPSPLNFQTPVMSNGPSFLRDEDGERKRKSPEGDGQEPGGNLKRVKT